MKPIRLALFIPAAVLFVTGHPRTALAQPIIAPVANGLSIKRIGAGTIEVFVSTGRCQCEANLDGSRPVAVEPVDLALFTNQWYEDLNNNTKFTDLDGNGIVQPADLALYSNLWYEECPVTQAWLSNGGFAPCNFPVTASKGTLWGAALLGAALAPQANAPTRTAPRLWRCFVSPAADGEAIIAWTLPADIKVTSTWIASGVVNARTDYIRLAKPSDYPNAPVWISEGATP